MDPEIQDIAAQLVEACRAGNLGNAYRVLQGQPFKIIPQIALRAGFSCISTENRRDFMAHLESQVAEATRNRADGFGLRDLKARSRQAKA